MADRTETLFPYTLPCRPDDRFAIERAQEWMRHVEAGRMAREVAMPPDGGGYAGTTRELYLQHMRNEQAVLGEVRTQLVDWRRL